MKKFITLLLTALLLTLPLMSCTGNAVPVIGISQYGEHSSLDNCREGFLQGLAEAGLVEGEDFTVLYQNAGFDDNICTQIGQNFSAKNVALMCGIATNAATACYAAAEDKDIPVVFNAISDPVEAKLDKGNVTGVSDKLPIAAQLELIRKCQPDAKKIGIIYTTSEPNSVSAIREYKALAPDYGFEIVDIGVTAQAEVTQAVDTILTKDVDCLSNLTDNNVVGVLDSILDKTMEANIPVYGSEIEQVKLGCVASAGIDYLKLGKQAGALAAKILKGEAKASELPYETVTEFDIYVNSAAVTALGMTLPEEAITSAIEVSAE